MLSIRHCEELSDDAIHKIQVLDCFALLEKEEKR